MAISSSIRFTKVSGSAGTFGQTYTTTASSSILIENNSAGAETSYTYTLLSVPYGSTVTPRVLASGSCTAGAVPSYTLAIDAAVGGLYLVELSVSDGSTTAVSSNSILVPNARGWVLPAIDSTDLNTVQPSGAAGWDKLLAGTVFSDIFTTLSALVAAVPGSGQLLLSPTAETASFSIPPAGGSFYVTGSAAVTATFGVPTPGATAILANASTSAVTLASTNLAVGASGTALASGTFRFFYGTPAGWLTLG